MASQPRVEKQMLRSLTEPSLLDDDVVVRTLGYFIINQNEFEGVKLNKEDALHFAVIDELGDFDLEHEKRDQNEKLKWPTSCSPTSNIVGRFVRKRLEANLDLLLQLLEALTKAHKNVYHRDFKPASTCYNNE